MTSLPQPVKKLLVALFSQSEKNQNARSQVALGNLS